MIEGEEIFESAQETGYRLCRSREGENDGQELVFSATWDLNVPNRLFVCMQNGELKTFNVEDKSSERFKVLFRRYTPIFETDSQIEKPVNHHWDKMTTIPDRPDELIFLLGISQKLMYTALPPPQNNPYPMQPLLASTARGDIPGFIFGSPVMEISSHQSRITALSVSPAGHILASGDENGKVRLLLLRLLDEISVFKQNERQRKKHTAATSFSKFLPTYNVAHIAHPGPIFSLQWLPIISSSDSNSTRNYALATGSVDRSVRIWRVTCSSSTGITMVPAMTLDTLTTHVLSLNSYLYTDRYVLAKINRMASMSASSTPTKDAGQSRFTFSLPRATTETAVANTSANANAAKSIFLAAGTSVGMVYVWKLDFMEILSCLDGTSAGMAGGKVVVDDGSKLHSLLQASERPIINVTLTAFPYSGLPQSPLGTPSRSGLGLGSGLGDVFAASGGDVVLAASDTLHLVHIFTPEKIASANEAAIGIKKDDIGKAALIRVGEQTFASPVVSCCFPPAYPDELEPVTPASPSSRSVAGAVAAKVDRWDPTVMTQRNGPLLIAAAHGELVLYSTEDLAGLSHDRQRTLSGDTSFGGIPRARSFSTAHAADDADSVDSVDSAVVATDQLLIRKNSMKKQSSFSGAAGRTATAVGSGSEEEGDGDEEVEQWETVAVHKPARAPSAPKGGPAPRKPPVQWTEDGSEYPRSGPPPAPTPTNRPATRPPLQRPAGPASGPSRGAPASPASSGSPSPSPAPAPSSGARFSPSHNEDDADARTDATSTPSSPSLPSPPKLLQEKIARRRQESAPKMNQYAVPKETFSKVLEAQVDDLAWRVENDEVSVSTLQTTQSDKLAAARAAQSSVSRRMRYGQLTPSYRLDNVDMEALMATSAQLGLGKKKLGKQVDPKWLSQRKYGGPSEEDLKALEIPDPLVSLGLSSTRLPAAVPITGGDRAEMKARQEYAFNSAFGLRQSVDESTLQPRYRLAVNMEQVFGQFNPTGAVQAGTKSREEFSRQQMLSLASNYPAL